MKFAIIDNNIVIDIIESETPIIFPPSPSGSPILVIECDNSIKKNMIYNSESNNFNNFENSTDSIISEINNFQEPIFSNIELKKIQNKNYDAYTLELINQGIL